MEEKVIGGKLPDDEELEKLFEGMSREAAREVVNQNSPSKRVTSKKTTKPRKIVYAEPAEYIPEDIRRKYKLGKYAEPTEEKNDEK